MEADFQRVYGLDLGDLRRGVMRPTRAATLAAQLPPGSMAWREAGGPLAWSDEVHMLARIEHGVRVLAWMQSTDAKQGRNRPTPMEPPRPLAKVKRDEAAVLRRARRYMKRAGVAQ